MTLSSIPRLFAGRGFRFSNEKELQVLVKGLLEDERIGFIREHHLGFKWPLEKGVSLTKDIIDFYLPEQKWGIEVKIKGGPAKIIAQVKRYLEHDELTHLFLLTSKQTHRSLAEDLPEACTLVILDPVL